MMSIDSIREKVSSMLRGASGIERYNPENIPTLEFYVDVQSKEADVYDLEANLALLKLYQFNPQYLDMTVVCKILMKALTNLPHTDFVLCKCLLSSTCLSEKSILWIINLAHLLETCQFKLFWRDIQSFQDLWRLIAGFDDSIRKYVCHVISVTYQEIGNEILCELLGIMNDDATVNRWIARNAWTPGPVYVSISNQEESIKTKKITEKIDIEAVGGIMASCF